MNDNPPLTPQLWDIAEFWRETGDSFSLRLVSRPGYCFEPGQFNMLYLFGMGEVPISISSDPGSPQQLVHSIRSVGAVTQGLAQLRAGDQIGVRGPFGQPWPVEAAQGKDLLIIAGGIGLAPLRPVIYRVLAQREAFGRVYLLYGARTPKDLLYPQLLKEWGARLDVKITVDRPGPDWSGQVGVVPRLIAEASFDPQNTQAFVCGPEVMMNFCVDELLTRGLADEAIHLSLERNMKCAQGFCGHCQLGPFFVCREGPVFSYDQIKPYLSVRGG